MVAMNTFKKNFPSYNIFFLFLRKKIKPKFVF